MKIIKLKDSSISANDLGLVVDCLLGGKVVVMPTDTVYGLHGVATNKRTVDRIIKIKRRPDDFGFVHLMKSYCMVHEWCNVSKKQDDYLRDYWPKTTRELHNNITVFRKKPTTFILNARKKTFGKKDATIAVRLPKNEILIKILKRINIPLISTSLNISGKEQVYNPKYIEKTFRPILPDLVLDAGVINKKLSSRLIDLRDIKNPKILRK